MLARFSYCACTFALACVLAGCQPAGPVRVEVSGSVTFDGEPLEAGTIAFIPAEGVIGPMAGGEIKGGSYKILPTDGPTTGPHRVEIRAWREAGEKEVAGVGGATEGPSSGGSSAAMEMLIPPNYNSQSELNATIEPGKNQLDFDLVPAS